MSTAIYPGSFNPPTIAHLAISEAVRSHHNVDSVIWAVSKIALAKESVARPLFEHRISVLCNVADEIDWLTIEITEKQLLADIAAGYDVLVMGADKWHQIQDPIFYENDISLRDDAIRRLPRVAIAPRGNLETPSELELPIPNDLDSVSSSQARMGTTGLMLQAALDFDQLTGAWTDPSRYERWLAENVADN
tara:strand:+ start:7073 stop:7648 length:576 start_codon:yes stop_codon:yes gene_type:complete